MKTEQLRADLHVALNGARFELSELGLYCHRNGVEPRRLQAAEAVLAAHGPVRVFDFKHESSGLAENGVPRDGADVGDYEGIPTRWGHRMFRIDHHYEVASLSATSSTPLVLRWIRGQWGRQRQDVLEEVVRSRYLADHADTDILLSNFLATQALDERVVRGPLGGWMAAAALRNDYIVLPGRDVEPFASRIFYACVGIEAAILNGEVTFAHAVGAVLPQVWGWLTGEGRGLDPAIAARLDAWDRAMRSEEERTLARIGRWEEAGLLRWATEGRVAILEAEEKIDNSDLYLYFLRKGRRPVVQALVYPETGAGARFTVKLRSHGGFDLNPLFGLLEARMPGSGFGGRAAAGGSRPIAAVDFETLVDVLRDGLDRATAP